MDGKYPSHSHWHIFREIKLKREEANTEILFTLHQPLETPINRAVGRGEEFSETLHPLFTTLHLNTFSRNLLKRIQLATSIINKTPRHFTN
jgi:hypothetical protein